VLSYAATLGETEARYVNAAFTAHETEAIATATPTPGVNDFLRAWASPSLPGWCETPGVSTRGS
jgi:hypothetical protein